MEYWIKSQNLKEPQMTTDKIIHLPALPTGQAGGRQGLAQIKNATEDICGNL